MFSGRLHHYVHHLPASALSMLPVRHQRPTSAWTITYLSSNPQLSGEALVSRSWSCRWPWCAWWRNRRQRWRGSASIGERWRRSWWWARSMGTRFRRSNHQDSSGYSLRSIFLLVSVERNGNSIRREHKELRFLKDRHDNKTISCLRLSYRQS